MGFDKLVAFVVLMTVQLAVGQELRLLGAMPMDEPGFSIKFDKGDNGNPAERYDMLQVTFSGTTTQREDVNMIVNPGTCLDDPAACTFYNIGDDFDWPREPEQIPEEVFGFSQIAHLTDGFLVPNKRDGAVYLADLRDQDNIVISDITTGASDDGFEWFYQQAKWYDADGDGLLDMFTCRTRITNVPAGADSQFLWFKNPGGDSAISEGPWEVGLILSENECDTALEFTTLQAGNRTYDVVFTTGYFSNTFNVYWTEDTEGLWTNPEQVNSRLLGELVDDLDCEAGVDMCGHFFDLSIADLNLDSSLDILMTINSGVYGELVVYEIPDDFRTGDYDLTVIVEGFVPTSGADNSGAPGQTNVFYPTNTTEGKPWILLSGDDNGESYYLIPQSQDVDDWQYELVQFVDKGEGQIVATPLPFDSNGDGYSEVFVPCWTANEILFFTFAP